MTEPADVVICMRDLRAAGVCSGIRTRLFLLARGFELRDVKRGRISAAMLEASGEPAARRVAVAARMRAASEALAVAAGRG